ncbi:MAG: putative drug exporter of the superfamily, partial [Solirubrobacteraceae bacterium]|nr:putative drug exporter of the superfamily [Solirubrobacteraceae bacterium]
MGISFPIAGRPRPTDRPRNLTGVTGLARWCFTHRRIVLAAWIAVLLVVGAVSASAGSGYSDAFKLPGTESTRALELLRANFKAVSGDTDQIVVAGDLKDPAVKQRAQAMLAKVAKAPHVTGVDDPFAPATGGRQIAPSGQVAFANVHFDGEQPIVDVPKDAYTKVIDIAGTARGAGLKVELGGNGIQQAIQQQGGASEGIGFLAAAIILLVAFGSFFSMLLPLLTAGIALGIAVQGMGLLAHVISIATFAPLLGTLIGLGVGIDYALFVVTRHRNSIRAGRTVEDACARALNTAGRAVMFAAGTVIIALLGLLVLGVSFLNGVAVGAALTVTVVAAAAVTLLPALLGFFGMKVLSRRERRRLAELGPRDPKLEGRWPKIAAFVMHHALPLSIAAFIVMLVLAAPVTTLRLGSSDAGNDPASTTTRKAYDLLAQGFGPGFNGTLQVVAETPGGESDLPKVAKLAAAMQASGELASVSPPVPSPNGRIALIEAKPKTAPQDARTDQLVDDLRNTIVPQTSTGLPVYVGGITAIFGDFTTVLTAKLPLFIAIIVLLGALLLMVAFRSLLIPAVAAVMNLLAAGAAFGVVTLVFQHGFLSGPLGVGTGPIEPFLPVIMLSILFGLSMDYQVFLVSRMHEEWLHTHDNSVAVRTGQASTGRVITAAAAIMMCVFLAFLLAGQRVIAEFGIGLA